MGRGDDGGWPGAGNMITPVLCFDLDGTLVDGSGRIHPKDVSLLAEAGLPALFVPTTGRPLEAVRRTLARNGLFVNQTLPFPAVLQNGAVLYGGRGHWVGHRCFEANLQKELVSLAGRFESVTFLFLSPDEMHILWPHRFGRQAAESYDFSVQPFTPASRALAFCKVMCLSPASTDLQQIAAATSGWPVERAFSMATIFEITPEGVNKGTGMQSLLKALGEEGAPVYAAGDGENDLPFLRLASRSFAPQTAPDNVRAQVEQIIDVAAQGVLSPMLRAAEADAR